MGCLMRVYLKMSKDNTNARITYTKANSCRGRRTDMASCIKNNEMQKHKEIRKLKMQTY